MNTYFIDKGQHNVKLMSYKTNTVAFTHIALTERISSLQILEKYLETISQKSWWSWNWIQLCEKNSAKE